MTTDIAPARRLRRRVSDWLGFFGHLAIAVITTVRTPALTVFVLPSIVHMLFAAGSFLVRDRPQRLEQSLFGRFVAYAGGFGVFVFIQFASIARPEWLAVTSYPLVGVIGVLLGVTGVCIEIWAIWHLKFAFSTEPAARRLVTTGPYRYVRHPIYSGSCVAYVGLIMSRPTIALGIALVGWGMFARLRMRYEEAILESVFPSYAAYRDRVGAILPRLSAGPKREARRTLRLSA